MTKHFAVLGSPISHSRSPQLHSAGFQAAGFDADYTRVELRSGIGDFVGSSATLWDGFSVTMPLKNEAAEFAQTVDEWVMRTGSCNTLRLRSGIWQGFNTDAYGLRRAVESFSKGRVLVLGSGATARTAYETIKESAAEISVWARSKQKLGWLESGQVLSTLPVLADYDLVVSSIPSDGLDAAFGSQPMGPKVFFSASYSTSPQTLASWGQSCQIVSGLEMLFWQAVAQQSLFRDVALDQLEGDDEFLMAMRHALFTVKE